MAKNGYVFLSEQGGNVSAWLEINFDGTILPGKSNKNQVSIPMNRVSKKQLSKFLGKKEGEKIEFVIINTNQFIVLA